MVLWAKFHIICISTCVCSQEIYTSTGYQLRVIKAQNKSTAGTYALASCEQISNAFSTDIDY